jgi:hypothetical protein
MIPKKQVNVLKQKEKGGSSTSPNKNAIGFLFGAAAGLAFAMTTWLPDAISLSRAHAVLPWLKFGIGTTVAVLLFSLAGWIAIRKQTLLITIVCFGMASFFTGILAGHLPFDITEEAIRIFDPSLSRLIQLPFQEGAMTRTVLTVVMNTVLVVIASLFFENLASQTYLAASRMDAIFPVIIFMAFFVVGGFIANDMNNRALRSPIVRMDALILEAQKIQSGTLHPNSTSDPWVETVLSLGINVSVPYRILVEKYDTVFSQLELLIQFGQDWYRCNMWEDQPFYCAPVTS